MGRALVAFLFSVGLSGCNPGPQYQVQRLPSGKELKVLGVGKMFFSGGPPALMLKYRTDLDLDDRSALEREVDEIWQHFRIDVERAGLTSAIISAEDAPKGFIVTSNRSFNFVYRKSADGAWRRGP